MLLNTIYILTSIGNIKKMFRISIQLKSKHNKHTNNSGKLLLVKISGH